MKDKDLFNEQIKLLTEIKNKMKQFNNLDGAKIELSSTIADLEEIIDECEQEKKEKVYCPLCDSLTEHTEFKGIHFWTCSKCSAVIFEHYPPKEILPIFKRGENE